MIEAAKVAVLEVNANLPFTYGDTLIHLDEIDHPVESERPLHGSQFASLAFFSKRFRFVFFLTKCDEGGRADRRERSA